MLSAYSFVSIRRIKVDVDPGNLQYKARKDQAGRRQAALPDLKAMEKEYNTEIASVLADCEKIISRDDPAGPEDIARIEAAGQKLRELVVPRPEYRPTHIYLALSVDNYLDYASKQHPEFKQLSEEMLAKAKSGYYSKIYESS